MTSTSRLIVALVLGLCAGTATASHPAASAIAVPIAQALGGLWLDALRMSVLPMISVMIVTGIGNTLTIASASGTATRTLALFAILLIAAAIAGVLLMMAILAVFPVPAAAHAARAANGPIHSVALPAGEWLRGFIPANPFAAAASGAVAPLVVFSLIFGLAATRIPADHRASLLGVCEAALQTLLVIVDWVLRAAAIGVAALAFVSATQIGLGAFGTLAHYVVTGALFCGLLAAIMVPIAAVACGLPVRRFAIAAAPAQMLALSTQSSIATLPAMVEAVAVLGGRAEIGRVVLPLAVSLFRVGSAASGGAIALYAAQMAGIELGPLPIAVAAGLSAAVSVAAVGLPSQASFVTVMSPICLAIGVPLDGLILLMAVDFLPDAFRTVANVTADIAIATIASRRIGSAHRDEEIGGGAQIGGIETFVEPGQN